jgi:hypothetical protein
LEDPIVTTDWLAQHLDEVTVLDVRGHVDTALVEPGVEKSTYIADYDAYLEGHIPVSKGHISVCSLLLSCQKQCRLAHGHIQLAVTATAARPC